MPKYMLVAMLNSDLDIPCLFFETRRQFIRWGKWNGVPRKFLEEIRSGRTPLMFKQPRKWEKGQHPVFTSYIHTNGNVLGYQLKEMPPTGTPFLSFEPA